VDVHPDPVPLPMCISQFPDQKEQFVVVEMEMTAPQLTRTFSLLMI
jgi:hypothetical protein